METGKSDEVREVGQEAVGPLNLPRPESMWWLQLSFFLCIVASGVLSGNLKAPLAQSFGWSYEEADVVAELVSNLSLVVICSVCFWLLNRLAPQLIISSGRDVIPLSTQPGIEMWAKTSRVENVVAIALCLIFGAIVMWAGFSEPNRSGQLRAWILLLFLVYMVWLSLRDLFHPLILLDEQNASLRGHRIPWNQTQKVEVQHRVSPFGDWISVRLTFFDLQGRKVAGVSLPKDQGTIVREEAILEFIAARLGRCFVHLAPTSPDWL